MPVKRPQPNGRGALLSGGVPGNRGGTGRPPDEIRAAMRELGARKGLPFLSELLDGRIPFTFTGTCSECGAESAPKDREWLKTLLNDVHASVDQRLKANEQAFKYGLGTKDEITVVSPEVKSRLIRQAQVIIETLGPEAGEALLAHLGPVWT